MPAIKRRRDNDAQDMSDAQRAELRHGAERILNANDLLAEAWMKISEAERLVRDVPDEVGRTPIPGYRDLADFRKRLSTVSKDLQSAGEVARDIGKRWRERDIERWRAGK